MQAAETELRGMESDHKLFTEDLAAARADLEGAQGDLLRANEEKIRCEGELKLAKEQLASVSGTVRELAEEKETLSVRADTILKNPKYFIAKNRIDLDPTTDIFAILKKVKELYKDETVTDIDGVKIDFADKWVHLRKSNTEPIIRVYSEAHTMEEADALGKQIMDIVYQMTQK